MKDIEAGQFWVRKEPFPGQCTRYEVLALDNGEAWMKRVSPGHNGRITLTGRYIERYLRPEEEFFVTGRVYRLKHDERSSMTYYIKDILKEGEGLFALARRSFSNDTPDELVILTDMTYFKEI